MKRFTVRAARLAACILPILLCSAAVSADPVAVRHAEGLVHGFLSLRTMDGTLVANGDLLQTSRGDRVTSRLVFHFKDGSIRDETAIFSQRGTFRLLRDHLVQKGPTFPQTLDSTIDCSTGQVTVRYTDDHGQEKVETGHMDLAPDLANGMTLTLLKNFPAATASARLSMVVNTPKARAVKLEITNAGEEPFTTGTVSRKATHYIVKIEIGGLAGLVAPLVGKQPPDTHVWVLGGDVPAFVKMEGSMFLGGPIWRIELVSPVWPDDRPRSTSR
jgi:hypothetical protein